MSAIKPSILRQPLWGETLSRHIVSVKGQDGPRRARSVNTQDLVTALRKAPVGDKLALPAGELGVDRLERRIFLEGASSGTVLKAPLQIAADFVSLTDLEICGSRSNDAVIVEKGILMLENCRVKGSLRIGSQATVFLKNCRVEDAEAGISLAQGAKVEMQGTRVTNCHSGMVLRDGSSATLFHSRFDHCAMRDGTEWGAAIFAHNAALHAEGVRFEQNGVGLYLTDCTLVELVASHLTQHDVAAIIFAGLASSRLTLRSCTIERQMTARCAQVSTTGGMVICHHTEFKQSPAAAASLNQSWTEIRQSKFSSEDIAIEAQGCNITAVAIQARSAKTNALSAAQCRGTIREGFFLGHPPTALTESNGLDITETSEVEVEIPNKEIESFLHRLEQTVTEESVRAQLERIFRQAHAAHQRRLGGLPRPRQNFHLALTGNVGLGKRAAAEWLAEAWHEFGVTKSEGLYDLTYQPINGHGNPYEAARGKTVFLSAREATGFTNEAGRVERALAGWMNDPNTVVILEGEREEIRRLVRLSPMLSEAFHHTLHFHAYGPVEFTTYFHQLCQADEITLSQEAAEAMLLLLHIYCDRKDKRFATRGGIRAFYEHARERYLERSSQQNRFDGELEIRDLNLPPEKALKRALEGSPAYASFCPSCHKENPWLPGLENHTSCLHCEAGYIAPWGIWRDSATYRRMTQPTTPIIEPGVISRRRSLLGR